MANTTTTAQTLLGRYCDLENVERSFRTMKATHPELRPVHVRKEASTSGHAFVVMLALLLQRQCEQCWRALDLLGAAAVELPAAFPMRSAKVHTKTRLASRRKAS